MPDKTANKLPRQVEDEQVEIQAAQPSTALSISLPSVCERVQQLILREDHLIYQLVTNILRESTASEGDDLRMPAMIHVEAAGMHMSPRRVTQSIQKRLQGCPSPDLG